jgi:uncharacterized membrane-anchored protein
MRMIFRFFALLTVAFSTGCATIQPPVSMSKDFWHSNGKTVAVNYVPLDRPSFYMEGDVRLLDYAIISAATANLSSHLKTLDSTDFDLVKDEVKLALEQQGFQVVVLEEPIDPEKLDSFSDPNSDDHIYFARKDYTPYQEKLNIDFLLNLRVSRMGVARMYHGFLPLADPRGIFDVHGEVIDLTSNKLLWYQDISESVSSNGNWDEPPSFPGLTNSFYIALDQARQRTVKKLKNPTVISKAPEKITQAKVSDQ